MAASAQLHLCTTPGEARLWQIEEATALTCSWMSARHLRTKLPRRQSARVSKSTGLRHLCRCCTSLMWSRWRTCHNSSFSPVKQSQCSTTRSSSSSEFALVFPLQSLEADHGGHIKQLCTAGTGLHSDNYGKGKLHVRHSLQLYIPHKASHTAGAASYVALLCGSTAVRPSSAQLSEHQPDLPVDLIHFLPLAIIAHPTVKLCLQRAAHRRPHAARTVSPLACFLIRLRHSAKKVATRPEGRQS